jgi:hypothetical protein
MIPYGPALGVGTVGYNELIDFDSPDEFEEREFLDRINAALPSGLRFKSLRPLRAGTQSLIKEVNRAEYLISLAAPEIEAAVERIRGERAEFGSIDAEGIHNGLFEAFIARETCLSSGAQRQASASRCTALHEGFGLAEDQTTWH